MLPTEKDDSFQFQLVAIDGKGFTIVVCVGVSFPREMLRDEQSWCYPQERSNEVSEDSQQGNKEEG